MKSILNSLIGNALSFLIFFVSLSFLGAQENQIVSVSKNTYVFQSKSYSRKELKEVIKHSPVAYDSYLKGMKKIKRTSQYALAAGFCLGAGYVVNNKEPNSGFGTVMKVSVDVSLYVLGLHDHYTGVRNVFLGSGVALGIISAISYTRGHKLVKKSIKQFNDSFSQIEFQNLKIGINSNGLGISYVF